MGGSSSQMDGDDAMTSVVPLRRQSLRKQLSGEPAQLTPEEKRRALNTLIQRVAANDQDLELVKIDLLDTGAGDADALRETLTAVSAVIPPRKTTVSVRSKAGFVAVFRAMQASLKENAPPGRAGRCVERRVTDRPVARGLR